MATHLKNIHAGLAYIIRENEGADEGTQAAKCLKFLAGYVGDALDKIEKDIARLERKPKNE